MEQGVRTWVLVVAIVAALLFGAVGGWLVRSSEVSRLEDRIAAAEEEIAKLSDIEDITPPSEETTAEPETPVVVVPETPETPAVVERVPAIVRSVRDEGGTYVLVLDYIQFLSGDEAAAAATAHGDESPPPNDYYIVNDNPKLREFPVKNGITVMVVVNDDGTVDAPDGHPMALAAWVGRLSGATADTYKSLFYWVTLTDNVITGLEQQYLP